MKTTLYIIFFYLICYLLPAQVPVTDTLPTQPIQNLDTLIPEPDTLIIRFSKDSIDSEVLYKARDSSDLASADKKIYLYGEASIQYKDFKIEADLIILDTENNIAIAEGIKDNDAYTGYAGFDDGSQDVIADRLIYNFKTKKGKAFVTRTKEGDLNIIAGESKFVAGENDDGAIFYGKNGVFTTCDAEKPHYGIRATKQKIVQDKVAIVGLSIIEISEVPTPLILPFGFFPLIKKAQKGIIFPRDYEFSEQWGFGLRGIGYYIPINDYVDATVLTDIYLRGSFGVSVLSNYKKRYKYNGRTELGYSYRTQENLSTGVWVPQRSFTIRWSHNQDPSAHPYRNLRGSVNIQTNNFQSLNFNDAQSVFTNTLNSNVSYTRTFPGKPYNISASLTHSQNTQTRQMDISFPNLDFQMQRIFPFKRKGPRIGKPKWYEDISVQYNGKAANSFKTTDTTLFTRETLDNAQFGIQHQANMTSNLRVLKYINVVPSVNYRESWYGRTVNYTFDPEVRISPRDTLTNEETGDIIIRYDTINGELIKSMITGFRAWRTIDLNASLNTQIFGTLLFKKGPIKGLRHVIKPNVTFNYTPDYTTERLDYYRSVQRSQNNMDSLFYSVFEGGIFGVPPRGGQQMGINYSLNNIFEAKYRFRRDTADKKLKLFDNIIINGNYNFAADSFKFSQVRFSGTHRLFKGMTVLSANLLMDPYTTDAEFRRVNVSAWKAERKLLKFVNFSTTLNSSLNFRTVREWFEKEPSNRQTGGIGGPTNLWDLLEGFSVSHTLMMGVARIQGRDTFMIGTNNINMSGSMQITEKWRINFGNIGWDFNSKQLTYPDIGFYRDLHCWEMGMDWQPLRGTYNFFVRVKPSSLDFLKVPYRKNNVDGLNRF